MSGIIRTARAIMTLLGPMTGVSATGNVTVHSTGATGTMPKNTYGIPVLGGSPGHPGELSPHVLVKTTAETNVVLAGTSVPVKTVLGSAAANLAAATDILWLPRVTGIEARSAVATPGLTGGTQATGYGSVQQIRFYEEMRAGNAVDILKANLGLFPAMVLTWDGSVEADAAGRQWDHVDEMWSLFIVASRKEAHALRAYEGFELIDEARERLTRRESVDDENFSSPGPIHIRGSGRIAVGAEYYLYDVRFSTTRTIAKRDPRSFATWMTAQYDLATDEAVPLPLVVEDQEDMSDA